MRSISLFLAQHDAFLHARLREWLNVYLLKELIDIISFYLPRVSAAIVYEEDDSKLQRTGSFLLLLLLSFSPLLQPFVAFAHWAIRFCSLFVVALASPIVVTLVVVAVLNCLLCLPCSFFLSHDLFVWSCVLEWERVEPFHRIDSFQFASLGTESESENALRLSFCFFLTRLFVFLTAYVTNKTSSNN